MKVGISQLVLPEEWSFEQTLVEVAGQGYDALELVVREEGDLTFDTSPGALKKMAGRAREAGIELVGLCMGDRRRERDMMTDDEEVRQKAVRSAADTLEVARLLGIGTVLWVPGRLTPALYYDRAYRNAVGALRAVAPAAEDKGVNLAVEYVWNNFLLSPLEFARFCDEVGSPRVGFYFDSGNVVPFSYPHHWVRICAEHLMAVHLKDYRRSEHEWTPLGEGDVDFAAVMRELREAGFSGALVSEVSSELSPPAETARAIRRIGRL